MAVYTNLGAEELARLIAHYDVGELVSAKGIAEGVSNSNWLIETTSGRFILTMYERRIELDDLPFFLSLLDHLAKSGCPVPATIHDRDGAASRTIDGKAIALIEFLPGVSPTVPTAAQAHAVGAALAQVHLAGQGFAPTRRNDLTPRDTLAVLEKCGGAALAGINPALPAMLNRARSVVAEWPQDLPRSIIHSDLFPDNVLMRGDNVTALIDFYFAANDMMAYDLAVTHAAWSFGPHGRQFEPAIAHALLADTNWYGGWNRRNAMPCLCWHRAHACALSPAAPKTGWIHRRARRWCAKIRWILSSVGTTTSKRVRKHLPDAHRALQAVKT